MPDKAFWVTSMYGYKSRLPAVVITVPGGEMLQVSPADARELALNLIAGAEAAEQDSFMFEWAMEKVGVDERGGAALLQEYREHREKKGRKTK